MLPRHHKPPTMTAAQAEEIGAGALAFLAEDVARLARFLSATGLSPQELRRDAANPKVLAAVLEHLSNDESLLLVYASTAGLSPADFGPAQELLEAASRQR
jgi:hypothetical protein